LCAKEDWGGRTGGERERTEQFCKLFVQSEKRSKYT